MSRASEKIQFLRRVGFSIAEIAAALDIAPRTALDIANGYSSLTSKQAEKKLDELHRLELKKQIETGSSKNGT